MDEQIIALSPRCVVCSRSLSSPDLPISQLHCNHCVCPACCWDLKQPNGSYKCPIDSQDSPSTYPNPDLTSNLHQYWSTDLSEVKFALGKLLLQDLPNLINYNDVPCFSLFGGNRPCSVQNCPYSHNNSSAYHRSVCPRLEKCPRKQYFCIFMHPKSEELQGSEGGQGSMRYSQNDPTYIALVAKSLNVAIPHVSKQVTHVEASKEALFFNTIQRTQEVGYGYVYLHSISLYRYLSSNNCEALNSILQRYSVSAQIRTMKVISKKVINWSYEGSDGRRKNFKQDISETLESAYQTHVSEVVLSPDSTVNLRFLIKIYQRKAYKPVFRTEKVLSSSHAAVLMLFATSDKCEQIYREVQMLEQYLLIPDSVPFPALDAVIAEFGLAVSNDGWVKGTKEDLFRAGERLKSIPSPDPISHISIKTAFNKEIIDQIAADFALLPLNNILVGRLSDLTRLQNEDIDVVPPRLTDDSRRLMCEKYHLKEDSGRWVGRLDSILEAWGEIQETTERLPANVTSEEMMRLRTGFPVLVENGSVIGPAKSVREAIQWLINARGLVGMTLNYPRFSNMSMDLFENWVFTQHEPVKIVQVARESPEFEDIWKRFGVSFVQELVSVEKVYNKKQYISYILKKERMKRDDESDADIAEMSLFHGPRTNDPREIAMSEEGFKHRYGLGSWGIGFYYALNPLKALHYAHYSTATPGLAQILLCRVLTGISVKEKSNRGMRRPPLRKDGKRYHSVEANGRGSLMWVVYEPEMAYPQYILTVQQPREV